MIAHEPWYASTDERPELLLRLCIPVNQCQPSAVSQLIKINFIIFQRKLLTAWNCFINVCLAIIYTKCQRSTCILFINIPTKCNYKRSKRKMRAFEMVQLELQLFFVRIIFNGKLSLFFLLTTNKRLYGPCSCMPICHCTDWSHQFCWISHRISGQHFR